MAVGCGIHTVAAGCCRPYTTTFILPKLSQTISLVIWYKEVQNSVIGEHGAPYMSLCGEGTSSPNCKTFFLEVSSVPKCCWKERTDSHAYRILDKEFYVLAALSLEFPQEKPVRKWWWLWWWSFLLMETDEGSHGDRGGDGQARNAKSWGLTQVIGCW